MILRYSIALLIPTFLHASVILLPQTPDISILEITYHFFVSLYLFSFFGLGLFVFIPTLLLQIVVARSLVKSEASYLRLFLTGLMNPSIAIISIFLIGCFYSNYRI
jgi:hypothetical protein